MQLQMSEEQHQVEALLDLGIAVGVDPRGLATKDSELLKAARRELVSLIEQP